MLDDTLLATTAVVELPANDELEDDAALVEDEDGVAGDLVLADLRA